MGAEPACAADGTSCEEGTDSTTVPPITGNTVVKVQGCVNTTGGAWHSPMATFQYAFPVDTDATVCTTTRRSATRTTTASPTTSRVPQRTWTVMSGRTRRTRMTTATASPLQRSLATSPTLAPSSVGSAT